MPSIVEATIPGFTPDDCEKQELILEGEVSNKSPSGDIEVVFPDFVKGSLPLSGGSIVKVDLSNLGIEIDEESNRLIQDEFSDLSAKNGDISTVVKFRNSVNKSLLRLKNFKILRDDAKKNPPKLFLSYLQGDDSHLDDKKSSSSVNQICKFKYVPYPTFNILLNKAVDIDGDADNENGFSEAIGISGKTFAELLADSESLSDENIIDFALEFFPIFNISKRDILKKRGAASQGGYYTIFNGNAYIKMPDISGRDSAGYYSDLFDDDSNFYLEVSIDRTTFVRSSFFAWAKPILATVDEGDVSLPEFEEVSVIIDSTHSPSDIKAAYLSILDASASQESGKSLKYFGGNVELFSIPMLTKNEYFSDRKGPYSFELADKDISAFIGEAESSISVGAGEESSETTGHPYPDSTPLDVFYGEMNRPELLLFNPEKSRAVRKNDRRYYSPKAYGAAPLLSSVHPKLYQNIPSKWIKSATISSGDEEEKINVSFDAADFDIINFEGQNYEAKFALYLEDNYGQITKAAGENISISTGKVVLEKISPNGYSGSKELISTDTNVVLTLEGKNLSAAVAIRVVVQGLDSGVDSYFEDTGLNYTSSNSFATLEIEGEMSSIGFEPGQEYFVSLLGVSGDESNHLPMYINTAKGDTQLGESKLFAKFGENEFSAKNFSGPVSGIPILTDSDAQITIRSKKRFFSGKYDIFAYIGVTSENVAKAIGGDDVIQVTVNGKNYYVLGNMEYEFQKTLNGDFASFLSAKKATIKLPGSKHSNYNLHPLVQASEGIIFIYNKTIWDDVENSALIPAEGDYGFVELGTETDKPFIFAPFVVQMIADIPANKIEYLATSTLIDSEALEVFIDKTIKVEDISMFQKMNKFGIIFYGAPGANLERQYKFYIGNKKINKYLSDGIIEMSGNRFLAVFDNVAISDEGRLAVYIEKKDKLFKYKTSSSVISKRASFALADGEYSLTTESELSLGDFDSNAAWHTSGLIANEEIITDLLTPLNSGIVLYEKRTSDASYVAYSDLTITSNITANITEVTSAGTETTTFTGDVPHDTIEIPRNTISLNSGDLLKFGEYSIFGTGEAVGYLNWDIVNGATIKCNVPEVYEILLSRGDNKAIPINEATTGMFKAGAEIVVRVRNTKRNFKVVFNNLFSAKTKGRPKKIGENTYEATIIIPSGVSTLTEGIDLCASGANSRRLGAKLRFGEKFVQNIGQNMLDTLVGNMKDKIPDIDDLKDLIKNFPLRFVNTILDVSLVPTDLINTFCDFSWHLAADLKLALNGFQILLIPIQVILCIIDVICALLHPGKVAAAVVRLFFCLYDLLLLLPQISIPVMFLQLILHLLKLLECVILKIVEIIIAVNEIIKAIEIAKSGDLWGTLKALEEILTEYLLELNIDLDVLEPVIAILAIFLQILALVFRFPCSPDDGLGDLSCGLQGSMLAGFAAAKISPNDGVYDTSVLLPIAQYYSDESIEDLVASGSGTTYTTWSGGDDLVEIGSEGTYYDAMEIDEASLRMTNGIDFNASFAASFTKSSKKLGKQTLVKFSFKNKGDNTGAFFNKKIIDPLVNGDTPMHLLNTSNETLKVASGKGNFISPIDGESFLSIDGDSVKVLPLTLTFDLPIMEANSETGLLEEVGIETVTRTFDGIPKMAIVDEEAGLYFIEEDGIKFDDDDSIKSITAKLISDISATKFRFTREERDVYTDDDDVADDEARVFDFPQLFFIDMRVISDQIQEKCYSASINEFLFDEDDSGDVDDITEIVQEGKDCIEEYRNIVKNAVATIRASLAAGEVPEQIDLNAIALAHQELIDCLNAQVDNICRFVVNPLNTSFYIEEDDDETPISSFPEVFDPSDEESLVGFEQSGPPLTGAREYAAGIGDSAVFDVGQKGTITIIPRDSYDIEVAGDLSNKIILNVISDSTGSFEIVTNEDDELITRNDKEYSFNVKANNEGVVKITSSVCSRTIQAVTYAGISEQLSDIETVKEVDCIEDTNGGDSLTVPLGGLTKIDRVLTLHYVRVAKVAVAETGDGGASAISTPQVPGTIMEN